MNIALRSACVAVLATLLAACATTPQTEHRSEKDPSVDLAAFRSFAWRPAAGVAGAEEPMRLLDTRIQKAITAELVRRGYTEDAAAPDFHVTYETAVSDKVRSSPVRFGIGMGSFGGNVGGSVNMGTPSIQNYQEGELVVRVIDAKTNREAWYGTVSGKVDKAQLDDAAVARAVAIALQDFPPRGT